MAFHAFDKTDEDLILSWRFMPLTRQMISSICALTLISADICWPASQHLLPPHAHPHCQQDADLPPPFSHSLHSIHRRHLFWLAFAVAMYIAGMVLSVLGVADLVRALNEVYPLHLYSQLESGEVWAEVCRKVWGWGLIQCA